MQNTAVNGIVTTSAIVAGVHALLLFFGLQVGTVGLVRRDAMRDILGDRTLLVFAARTLPLSWRHLLATFLAKDVVYYVALFVTPVATGLAPLVMRGSGLTGVLSLWITAAGTFALGAAASLALVGLATRSRVLPFLPVAVVVGLFLVGVELVAFTPYGAYVEPGIVGTVRGFIPTVGLSLVAPLVYAPTGGADRQVRRIDRDTHGRLRQHLGDDPGAAVAVRSLREVRRSSGSIWKVAVSLGILFAVALFLVDRVTAATALRPNPGLALGGLLGLGSFTTYNWVTSRDDSNEYLRYPMGSATVFAGKGRAFLLLTVPTGLGYLALGAIRYPPSALAVGVLVFPPVAVYVFGLTAFLTGLSPNEFLFDTALFALFGFGLAVVAVPVLVAALAGGRYPLLAPTVAVVIAVGAGFAGLALARPSGPRWDRRLRHRD